MATIEERISRIEHHLGLAAEERSKRTSNPVAYYMAIDAEIAGDRKPMKEYLKHYAIPTMQRGLVGGTAVRNRRG